MDNATHQGLISDEALPEWKNLFSKREYQYLMHVVNGLIQKSDFTDFLVQHGTNDGKRAFHIFEPFTVLNALDYMSPSVVSIVFNDSNQIEFWVGQDNGLEIFSNQLNLRSTSNFPRNSTLDIDFWHFIDAIGDADEENTSTLEANQ